MFELIKEVNQVMSNLDDSEHSEDIISNSSISISDCLNQLILKTKLLQFKPIRSFSSVDISFLISNFDELMQLCSRLSESRLYPNVKWAYQLAQCASIQSLCILKISVLHQCNYLQQSQLNYQIIMGKLKAAFGVIKNDPQRTLFFNNVAYTIYATDSINLLIDLAFSERTFLSFVQLINHLAIDSGHIPNDFYNTYSFILALSQVASYKDENAETSGLNSFIISCSTNIKSNTAEKDNLVIFQSLLYVLSDYYESVDNSDHRSRILSFFNAYADRISKEMLFFIYKKIILIETDSELFDRINSKLIELGIFISFFDKTQQINANKCAVTFFKKDDITLMIIEQVNDGNYLRRSLEFNKYLFRHVDQRILNDVCTWGNKSCTQEFSIRHIDEIINEETVERIIKIHALFQRFGVFFSQVDKMPQITAETWAVTLVHQDAGASIVIEGADSGEYSCSLLTFNGGELIIQPGVDATDVCNGGVITLTQDIKKTDIDRITSAATSENIARIHALFQRFGVFFRGLLTDTSCEFIISLKRPQIIVEKFNHFEKLIKDVHDRERVPNPVVKLLDIFCENDFLTERNLYDAVSHLNLDNLVRGLNILKEIDFLNEDIFNRLLKTLLPHDVATAIQKLKEFDLFTRENCNYLYKCMNKKRLDFDNIVSALISLHRNGILTEDNRNFLFESNSPLLYPTGLIILHKADLLTKENCQLMCDCTYKQIVMVMEIFNEVNLFTAENGQVIFNALIKYENILLSKYQLWNRIPAHLLTMERFLSIIEAISIYENYSMTGIYVFESCVDNLVMFVSGDILSSELELEFNRSRSTYTNNLNKSVYYSAFKLYHSYGDKLKRDRLAVIENEIISYISQLPKNKKQTSIQLLITTLIDMPLHCLGQESSLPLRILLSLIWLGLNDDVACEGVLTDRQSRFIDCLYEIQQTYAIPITGLGNGLQKKEFIFLPGTFNKLMESLVGIHRYVSFVYDIKTYAFSKLLIIVGEEANKYILSLSDNESELRRILSKVISDNFTELWDAIRPEISNRLFAKFSSIYPEGETSSDFCELIDVGISALDATALIKLIHAQLPQRSLTSSSFGLFSTAGAFGGDDNELVTKKLSIS